MIIVADSSALIALATCSALDVLIDLYDDVYVPNAVYLEVIQPNKPQSAILRDFLDARVVEIDPKQFVIAVGGLGAGELEAMALYQQLQAHKLLIDDRQARRVAEANGIECIGALGLLLLAKHHGHISAIAPFIDQLRDSSLHYSQAILLKVLQLANEG